MLTLGGRLYADAADRGCGLSMTRLAFLKTHGRPGVVIDHASAKRWRRLLNSRSYTSSPVQWLRHASENGLGPAQLCLSLCFYNGLGIDPSDVDAFKWCRLAVPHQHHDSSSDSDTEVADHHQPQTRQPFYMAVAQTTLGNYYMDGTGCTADPAAALSLYIAASRLRDPAAIYNIGTLYERGNHLAANMDEAISWYVRASLHGSVNAFNTLGVLSEGGIASPRHALRYYQTAADQGHPHAQYNLARCLHEGHGMQRRDDEQAVYWYARASAQDHTLATFHLAVCTELGLGLPAPCLHRAELLYEAAALDGHALAARRLVPLVARRLADAAVILTATPRHRGRLGLLPIELRLLILQYVDPAGVLTRSHRRLIYDAAFDRASWSAVATPPAGHVVSKRRAAAFVMERLDHEWAVARSWCGCKPGHCDRIAHVVHALERLDAAGC
ncbi:hypothetical protein BC831DRAFT_448945 [Entophlyctis helioformis]|nr:hypothetical protein BC831DRAFT_448945 [Entophlyctis helioformis]